MEWIIWILKEILKKEKLAIWKDVGFGVRVGGNEVKTNTQSNPCRNNREAVLGGGCSEMVVRTVVLKTLREE